MLHHRTRRRVNQLLVGAITLALGLGGSAEAVSLPHGAAKSDAAQASIWSVVTSPNPSGAHHTLLYAVSGDADNDVWAVGSSSYFEHEGKLWPRALIEHWNGSAWSTVPSPNAFGSVLRAVAAIAPNNAWAVGSFAEPGAQSSR